MPRRAELQGVANDFVHWFLSRNNDAGGYWAVGKLRLLCEQNDFKSLNLKIWPLAMHPSAESTSNWAQSYSQVLSAFLAGHRFPKTWLVFGSLALEFEPMSGMRAIGSSEAGTRFQLTLELVTDVGKKYIASGVGNCLPHNPNLERRSLFSALRQLPTEQMEQPGFRPTANIQPMKIGPRYLHKSRSFSGSMEETAALSESLASAPGLLSIEAIEKHHKGGNLATLEVDGSCLDDFLKYMDSQGWIDAF